MKVLVDNGVVSSANFLIADSREHELRWGKTTTRTPIVGFKRAGLDPDPEQQNAKDALFTIGRLARQGLISLYTYHELVAEKGRGGRGREPFLNAFSQCKFQHCRAPVERSRFRQTSDIKEWFAKGGRADEKKGRPPSEFNQIAYLRWLSALSRLETAVLVSHASAIGLDDFEIASLNDLPWFQRLSWVVGSTENLPDCFHLWTVRRNNLDGFLTLEKKLPRTIQDVAARRNKPIDVGFQVLRPTEFLQSLGITEIDPVPVEMGRFYTYAEISEIQQKLVPGHDANP